MPVSYRSNSVVGVTFGPHPSIPGLVCRNSGCPLDCPNRGSDEGSELGKGRKYVVV